MNAKQLKDIVDNSHINSHVRLCESIRRRFDTAAGNGYYKITFDARFYDGPSPFLLPESVRKSFLEELTKDGFVVECETRWWKRKTITISWHTPLIEGPSP